MTDIKQRYENAHKLLNGVWSDKVAKNSTIFPVWIGDTDTFSYVRQTSEGWEYRFVDPGSKINRAAFDQTKFAGTLAEACNERVDSKNLPISEVEFTGEARTFSFSAFGKHWSYDCHEDVLTEASSKPDDESVSPDGRYSVRVRNDNLWLLDRKENTELALTLDGEEHFSYGAPSTAWGLAFSNDLQVLWSQNSKRLLAVQRDTRSVKELPIVHHIPSDGSLRPKLEMARIAYPGDEQIETFRVVSIDIERCKIVPADYKHIPVIRNNPSFFKARLAWWSSNGETAFFVDLARGDQSVRIVGFDTRTGETQVLFEERSDTQISLMLNTGDLPTLMPIAETDELIWFSERSGWAHLYLIDLQSGDIKNVITAGEWVVRDLLHFNPNTREAVIQTGGRATGRDPYYRDIVRVNIDTGVLTPIAESDHDYFAVNNRTIDSFFAGWGGGIDIELSAAVSPSGRFIATTRSRVDERPITLLLNDHGEEVMQLEQAELVDLPRDWTWPEPVRLLAADGETEVFGAVFRPSGFSENQKYPVVSCVFNSPEAPYVAKGSFSNSMYFGYSFYEAASLAELGFIVVQIDGRGTPFRSKAFMDESYGWINDVSNFDDHIAGIKQLAERYPYMDLKKVGVVSFLRGPSGAYALLNYPDFFHVGITGVQFDSRLMPANMWGDKWEGTTEVPENKQHQEYNAENLAGKLLLLKGLMDRYVPPAATFRVVEALQRANKDFELIIEPKELHTVTGYQIRRSWDFLVRHLLNETPPENFRVTAPWEGLQWTGIEE